MANKHKTFGQIPKPHPEAAADVASAARHIESLLPQQHHPDPDFNSDIDRVRSSWIDLPSTDDSQEEIEDLDSSSQPGIPEKEEESHDGVVGKVVEKGIEYVAFYKSFRDVLKLPARGRWGIFIIKKRCFALATDMSFSTGESIADCLDGLVAFLYGHELYHFRFDAHCLQIEATGGLPVYRPYRRLVDSRPMSEWHEESVANFYGLKALQTNHWSPYPMPIHNYLWDLVKNSSGAYSGGTNRRQTQQKNEMARQASAAFGKAGPAVWQDLVTSIIRVGTNLSMPREFTLSSRLSLNVCPVHWIDWIKGGKSILVPNTISISETKDRFITRYLKGIPCRKSDHSFFRIDNGEKIKLPNPHRKDLTNGEFHNIIRKAGMTSPFFHQERKRTSVWAIDVPRRPILPPRGGS